MTEAQAATTRFCARVVGPLILIVGAVVIARAGDMVLLIPAILQDGPLTFITGVFTLICGIVLIAAHHHWNSAAAIAISLLGVLTIVRGITLLFAPSMLTGLAHQFLNLGPGALIAGVIALILGAWLSFVGWFAKRPA
jgi:FtsH-binding integral membrane protein